MIQELWKLGCHLGADIFVRKLGEANSSFFRSRLVREHYNKIQSTSRNVEMWSVVDEKTRKKQTKQNKKKPWVGKQQKLSSRLFF